MGPDAEKRIPIRVLRDVAWGPVVETGAGVPGYSGGAKLQRVNYSPKPAASPVISPSHS
jgi:hypothetical protein